MSVVMINPGASPVKDVSTYENAYENIEQFIKDCEIPMYIVKSEHIPDEGRYLFVLRNDEYNYQIEVEMPGLPLDRVRYIKAEGQNVLDFPRLYVDGGSWLWYIGVVSKENIKEILEERIEEMEIELEKMRKSVAILKGEENG